MPSDLRPIIVIRGTEEYRAAIEELSRLAGYDSVTKFAEYAIGEIAKSHDITLPDRIGQRGGTRKGAGRKKSD